MGKPVFEKVIKVDRNEALEIQQMLDGEIESPDDEETIEVYTADFENGIEVDIKVVSCQTDLPYVDAVIFKDGNQLHYLEPDYNLLGEYQFELKDGIYVVNLEEDNTPGK